jgi:hypothetical protein
MSDVRGFVIGLSRAATAILNIGRHPLMYEEAFRAIGRHTEGLGTSPGFVAAFVINSANQFVASDDATRGVASTLIMACEFPRDRDSVAQLDGDLVAIFVALSSCVVCGVARASATRSNELVTVVKSYATLIEAEWETVSR